MDVVLDVREQLKKPLIRFRAALAKASGEVESPAWESEEFVREVDDLYHRDVAPALADLDDAMRELGVLPTLRRVASHKEVARPLAFLTMAAAAGVGLGHLPEVVFGVPPVATGIAGAAREAETRHDIRRRAEANEFYFLYEANRHLGSG